MNQLNNICLIELRLYVRVSIKQTNNKTKGIKTMYNRKQFINKIQDLESINKTLLWNGKIHKGVSRKLPFTDRRLAQLIELKILNPIRKGSNCTYFNDSHIERYKECTKLKNKGFKIPQIASHFNGVINANNIDMTQYQNKQLTTQDKKRIIETIEQLTKLLKDNI